MFHKLKKLIFCAFILGTLMSTTGCDLLGRMMPGKIGDGVSRLTVRNSADILKYLEEDTVCGFSSDLVANGYETVYDDVEGKDGEKSKSLGTVTWRVKDCPLEFPEETEIGSDCNGNQVFASGKVVVSAEKIIHGRITNNTNPKMAVVPMKQNDVKIVVRAEFSDFEPTHTEDNNVLKQVSGNLSFEAEPHLARSSLLESKDLCAIPTSDVTIKNMIYSNAELKLSSGILSFNVPVSVSDIEAQAGIWEDVENKLSGKISVWSSEVDLPSDDEGLDPEYTREKFLSTFMCAKGLGEELDYKCMAMDQKLAQGASSLSAMAFGQVINTLDINTVCGFSEPSVVQTATVTGDLGNIALSDGQAIFNLANGKDADDAGRCKLSLGDEEEPTKLDEDCYGVVRYGSGVVYATGTKTVQGLRVLDDDTLDANADNFEAALGQEKFASLPIEEQLRFKPEPVLPLSSSPAEVQMEMNFDNFRIFDQCEWEVGNREDPNHCSRQAKWMKNSEAEPAEDNIKKGPQILLTEGTLRGRVTPTLGLETDPATKEYGVCAKKIPIATFSDLEHLDTQAELDVEGNHFLISLGAADDKAEEAEKIAVTATTGRRVVSGEEQHNQQVGRIKLDGNVIELANLDASTVALDPTPTYSEELYNMSFNSCKSSIKITENTAECNLNKMLNENIARLIIQNTGGLAKLLSGDEHMLQGCSIKGPSVLSNRYFSEDDEDRHAVVYGLSGCTTPENGVLGTDDNGDVMSFTGKATVKTVDDVDGVKMFLAGKKIPSKLPGWVPEIIRVGWEGGVKGAKELHVEQTAPDSATMMINSVDLHDFAAFMIEKGERRPMAKMTIHNGNLSAVMKPIMAESKSDPDHFYIQTPIATFENVSLTNADVTLETKDGMVFKLHIEESDLFARNGFYEGAGNYINGYIKLGDREEHVVPDGTPLVPAYPKPYDQARFNASYSKTADLKSVISRGATDSPN